MCPSEEKTLRDLVDSYLSEPHDAMRSRCWSPLGVLSLTTLAGHSPSGLPPSGAGSATNLPTSSSVVGLLVLGGSALPISLDSGTKYSLPVQGACSAPKLLVGPCVAGGGSAPCYCRNESKMSKQLRGFAPPAFGWSLLLLRLPRSHRCLWSVVWNWWQFYFALEGLREHVLVTLQPTILIRPWRVVFASLHAPLPRFRVASAISACVCGCV